MVYNRLVPFPVPVPLPCPCTPSLCHRAHPTPHPSLPSFPSFLIISSSQHQQTDLQTLDLTQPGAGYLHLRTSHDISGDIDFEEEEDDEDEDEDEDEEEKPLKYSDSSQVC